MRDNDRSAKSVNRRKQRRGRRRRDFLDALQQTQAAGHMPVMDVGQRLRDMRTDHGFTIRDLAKNSGLNVNTLSMIENGKTSPSLETLQQLSFALDMPIAAFFEDNTPKNEIVYYKSDQRPNIVFTHGELQDLGAGMPRRNVEIFLVTLKPHSSCGEDPIVHTGRETVFCLEGKLTYTIKEQTYVLEAGDSLFFEAHLPHRWQNTGDIPSRSLLVLCPSDDQDCPSERHFSLQQTRVEGRY